MTKKVDSITWSASIIRRIAYFILWDNENNTLRKVFRALRKRLAEYFMILLVSYTRNLSEEQVYSLTYCTEANFLSSVLALDTPYFFCFPAWFVYTVAILQPMCAYTHVFLTQNTCLYNKFWWVTFSYLWQVKLMLFYWEKWLFLSQIIVKLFGLLSYRFSLFWIL